jgi:hypothetical protein
MLEIPPIPVVLVDCPGSYGGSEEVKYPADPIEKIRIVAPGCAQ